MATPADVDPVLAAAQNALELLHAERPELTFEIVLPAEQDGDAVMSMD